MQFQICNSGEVWTSISAAEAHRIARKRTGALARIVREARKARKQEAQEYRRAERGLQQEIREADRRSRALWKPIRVKPDDGPRTAIERKPQAHRPTRGGWLAAASQLPRYSGQIIDRMGRAGIFFRVRYYGHATKTGVGRRATLYIWQGAHEMDDGRILFMSNVGETVDEAVAALEAIELFNREAQEGAKVLFHAIANVPYQLLEMNGGIERMFEIGRRFAEEQFGDRDLPFALALHPPAEEGDQRNWHLHLLFSTRPLLRTGHQEWDIGRMMRREIDNPEAFEAMRHLYARVQTEVVQEAGLNIRYTALSNAERGLPIAPQQHLDPARTARVRRGERDEVNERNWQKSLAGEAALVDEQLRHSQEAAAAEHALIDRVEARLGPLATQLAAAPPLTTAMVGSHAAPLSGLINATAALSMDEPLPAPTLPVANMQPCDRTISDVAEARRTLQIDARDMFGSLPAHAVVRSNAGSIDVPRPAPIISSQTTQLSPAASLSGVQMREHQFGRMPRVGEPVTAVTQSLPISRPIPASTQRVIARSPALPVTPTIADGLSLSFDVPIRAARRSIDVPKQSALSDDVVVRDIDVALRLLDARRAEMARRERARRERAAAERAEAERARKARDEQRAREEAERHRLEVEQALARQAERDAADALDSMLERIEAERLFVTFADDRCVVDAAISERFGVTAAAVASEEAQARLDAIADRQRAEIKPIVTHVSRNGAHLVHSQRGWTLSADAPDHLRRIADAWVHEPVLQRAFAQAAAVYRAAQADAQLAPRTKPAIATGQRPSRRELLILAAQQREALSERWQQSRRFDDAHAARSAGAAIVEQRSVSTATPRRRLPFDPSRGR